MQTDQVQTYYTKREAAQYARHCQRALDAAKAIGELPYFRCGARKVLFRRDDLDKWLNGMRVDAAGGR